MTRQPRAFRLDDPDVTGGTVVVTDEPFDAIEAADGVVVPMNGRRRAPWLAILLSALSGLVVLGDGQAGGFQLGGQPLGPGAGEFGPAVHRVWALKRLPPERRSPKGLLGAAEAGQRGAGDALLRRLLHRRMKT